MNVERSKEKWGIEFRLQRCVRNDCRNKKLWERL